jgi:hypothetical protein
MKTKIILLLAVVLCSCEANEIPEPVKTPNVVRSYTIQTQYNGITIFPKYIQVLKLK